METNRVNVSNPPQSTLLKPTPKPEPNAPTFIQALANATETPPAKTLKADPAALARPIKPRSHLELYSLNPAQTHYTPQAAALERVGASRILPVTVSS